MCYYVPRGWSLKGVYARLEDYRAAKDIQMSLAEGRRFSVCFLRLSADYISFVILARATAGR